jgi:hypothetical protein
MISGTTQDNLFNIDHGKALAPHREAEANLFSVSQFMGMFVLTVVR